MAALNMVKPGAVLLGTLGIAALHASPVDAQTMYKCADTSGAVSYQTRPCGAGKQQLWARESKPAAPPPPQRSSAAPGPKALPTVTSGTRTIGGRPACLSEDWHSEFGKFIANGDVASMERYVAMQRCMLLKPDIRVTLIDGPALFQGYVTFVANGVKFWGDPDSIHYE